MAEAEAAGMKYSDYVESMAVTTRRALDSATDAYQKNEKIIQDSTEVIKNAEIDMVRVQNDILADQVKTGQEVTGIYASESEARIGIAEIEAQRIAEINRQANADRVSDAEENADNIISAEEELEEIEAAEMMEEENSWINDDDIDFDEYEDYYEED